MSEHDPRPKPAFAEIDDKPASLPVELVRYLRHHKKLWLLPLIIVLLLLGLLIVLSGSAAAPFIYTLF